MTRNNKILADISRGRQSSCLNHLHIKCPENIRDIQSAGEDRMGTKIKVQNMLSIQTGMQQLLVQQCRELLRPFVRSLTFDRFQTHNNTQHHAITCKRVCKRTQHVSSNNVASVCTGLNVSNRIKVIVKGPKYYFQISQFC